LFRDTGVFRRKHLSKLDVGSMGGYHIREAGATDRRFPRRSASDKCDSAESRWEEGHPFILGPHWRAF
jgi:hypothetical protein